SPPRGRAYHSRPAPRSLAVSEYRSPRPIVLSPPLTHFRLRPLVDIPISENNLARPNGWRISRRERLVPHSNIASFSRAKRSCCMRVLGPIRHTDEENRDLSSLIKQSIIRQD